MGANGNKLTIEKFIQKAKLIHGERYDYSKSFYRDSSIKIEIICKTHGSFLQLVHSHLAGHGCRECSSEQCSVDNASTFEKFVEKAKLKHGDFYDYPRFDYKNSHKKISIICPEHGEFKQTIYIHTQGSGCPNCKKSKGELSIRNWLTSKNINFEEQRRFAECRHKRELPFDFYLPEKNLCIEYDGIQHFRPYSWTSKESDVIMNNNFSELQLKDSIKTEYCQENNIKLIRIKYTELKKIDRILSKIFSAET